MSTHNLERPPAKERWSARQIRRLPLWLLLAFGAVIVAVLVPLSLVLTNQSNTAQTSADAANATASAVKATAAPLAGQVQSVCSQGGEAAAKLNNVGACTQAQQVISAVQIPGPSGPQGPGPSQEQIDAAVNRYFLDHPLPPGQLPPVSEVTALVAQVYAANPPAPGQNATPGMVATAVSNYCDAHNGCAGPAGQNATADMVLAAVTDYCAAHNNCAGPAGANGADGQPGATGQPGPTGATGPPPAGWTYVDALGRTRTCTPAPPPTGQSAPWYACS